MIRSLRKCLIRKVIPCGLLAATVYLLIVLWTAETLDSDKMQKENNKNSNWKLLPWNFISYVPEKKISEMKLGSFNHFQSSQHCLVKKNFVFIKCMKCATESMGLILRKFALNQNLQVMLPREKNIYLGWPFPMDTKDFRSLSPGTRHFNCLIEHAIYNSTVMSRYFPGDTQYITLLRHPWSHFKSTFAYFNLKEIAQVMVDNPITEYLHNLEAYELIYKSHTAKKRYCIPDNFSITKNLQSHCLGMPTGFPQGREDMTKNNQAVEQYIDKLSKEFTLVMIVEYFHESLVLLKRIMCWSLKDLIYKRVNVGKYHFFTTADDRLIHKEWSLADYKLYDHFNKTFWMKVEAEGANFFDEVQHFTKIQQKVNIFCNFTGDSSSSDTLNVQQQDDIINNLIIPQSPFNEEFQILQNDCDEMNSNVLELLKDHYDSYVPWKDTEPAVIPKRGC